MALALPFFRKFGPYLTGQTNNIRVRLMDFSNAEVSAIRYDQQQFLDFFRLGMFTHFIK